MPRILLSDEPFVDDAAGKERAPLGWGFDQIGLWPAHWIDHPQRPQTVPSVAVFRLPFSTGETARVRIHVSADNRYLLYLDNKCLGRGPERGDPLHWRFESYDLELAPGKHILVALNWWLSDQAALAQMSVRPAFLLAAEGEWQDSLSTGAALWEASLVQGVDFLSPGVAWGTGAKVRIDGKSFPWGWESGKPGEWLPAIRIVQAMSSRKSNYCPPVWLLTPSSLPPMMEEPRTLGRLRHLVDANCPYPVRQSDHLPEEAQAWQSWLAGEGTVTLTAGVSRRAIIDLEQHYCAYPVLRVSGGAGGRVRLNWSEGLYEKADGGSKGNRNDIEGKYFLGTGDEFLPDGGEGRAFTTLWWEAGRYLELTIEAAGQPLTLESLVLYETRYPLEMEGAFACSDPRPAEVIPNAVRSLQMCSHETYMDCPYYEQLMWITDARLEALTTYVLTRDDRLPRKALDVLGNSRRLSGMTEARFPARDTQTIAPFSLWWVCMVHDYWLWRDDAGLVCSLLPGIRAVMEGFRPLLRGDGLLDSPPGWNFVDWVKEPLWEAGVPFDAEYNPNSIINLQFALALLGKAEMEAFYGERALAGRDRDTAARVCQAVVERFWNKESGILADDLAQTRFSEHAQCLAILTGLLQEDVGAKVADGLLHSPALARTTIYFSHYLFEALYRLGKADRILERLALWLDLKSLGVKTTLEMPEPGRSDCHGYGAHPLYHFYASLLGIRPAGQGFRKVRIAPQLGSLAWAEGTLPHPAGDLHVHLQQEAGRLKAEVALPSAVSGVFVWGGYQRELVPGGNAFEMPAG